MVRKDNEVIKKELQHLYDLLDTIELRGGEMAQHNEYDDLTGLVDQLESLAVSFSPLPEAKAESRLLETIKKAED